MIRGDDCERGPLTAEEKESCKKEIDLFCSREDPEFVPDLSGGMLFIREGDPMDDPSRVIGVSTSIIGPSSCVCVLHKASRY